MKLLKLIFRVWRILDYISEVDEFKNSVDNLKNQWRALIKILRNWLF